MSGNPLFFAKFEDTTQPDRNNKFQSYQVGVIAIDIPSEMALILHKKKLLRVSLNDLSWERWD